MSSPVDSTPVSATESLTIRWQHARWGLALIVLAFVLWRGPTMYLSSGGQDEECYAVPGFTILNTGLPQLPHLPSRNPESPYYRADEVIFLEPPLFFYAQALLYAVLPIEYGTARLLSAFAGIVVLAAMVRLAVIGGMTVRGALWGAGLFMMSRWFYFNATAARPDALCSAWGMLAILACEIWTHHRQPRWLVITGVLIGLGGLTHPFALVYAVQLAVWMFLVERGVKRWLSPVMLAGIAIAVASVWGLLVLQFPDIFVDQFRNQFLSARSGSLIGRLLWPWPSVSFHVGFLWPHINPWQFGLVIAGALISVVRGLRERNPVLQRVGWLSISGAGLLCILVGPHHPVFGYFSYPSALAFIGVGWGVDGLFAYLSGANWRARAATAGLAAGLVISLLLGSGIRVSLAYFRNFNDLHFHGPRFAQQLLSRLPPDATYLVDEEFALDFLRAGRRMIAFRAIVEAALPPDTEYDYRIEGRSTDRYFSHLRWNDELEWVEGDPSEPYGIYVRVHRRRNSDADR